MTRADGVRAQVARPPSATRIAVAFVLSVLIVLPPSFLIGREAGLALAEYGLLFMMASALLLAAAAGGVFAAVFIVIGGVARRRGA